MRCSYPMCRIITGGADCEHRNECIREENRMKNSCPNCEKEKARAEAAMRSLRGEVGSETDPFAERPEAFVGAAFAGGLALALILRRFAR